MKSLDEFLQAAVAAINESGLEPQEAVAKPVKILIEDDLITPRMVKWREDDDCFYVTAEWA